jgi:hypothetical protein
LQSGGGFLHGCDQCLSFDQFCFHWAFPLTTAKKCISGFN